MLPGARGPLPADRAADGAGQGDGRTGVAGRPRRRGAAARRPSRPLRAASRLAGGRPWWSEHTAALRTSRRSRRRRAAPDAEHLHISPSISLFREPSGAESAVSRAALAVFVACVFARRSEDTARCLIPAATSVCPQRRRSISPSRTTRSWTRRLSGRQGRERCRQGRERPAGVEGRGDARATRQEKAAPVLACAAPAWPPPLLRRSGRRP